MSHSVSDIEAPGRLAGTALPTTSVPRMRTGSIFAKWIEILFEVYVPQLGPVPPLGFMVLDPLDVPPEALRLFWHVKNRRNHLLSMLLYFSSLACKSDVGRGIFDLLCSTLCLTAHFVCTSCWTVRTVWRCACGTVPGLGSLALSTRGALLQGSRGIQALLRWGCVFSLFFVYLSAAASAGALVGYVLGVGSGQLCPACVWSAGSYVNPSVWLLPCVVHPTWKVKEFDSTLGFPGEGPYNCSACGQSGHNARNPNCPKKVNNRASPYGSDDRVFWTSPRRQAAAAGSPAGLIFTPLQARALDFLPRILGLGLPSLFLLLLFWGA